jgi:hypothetical protein
MATEWFYARGDQKHGPVSSAELSQLARNGKLLRTDLIWKEGMSQWRPAGEAAKLFEGVTNPEPAPSNTASPPTESATAAFGDKAKAAAKSLGEKAKSAAQAAAAQAEIARLTQIALPSAYAAVGRHVIQSADIRKAFPDAVAVIDTLLAKLESLKTGAANRQPSTFAEKAKAVALATKELAESKAHELRLGQAYADLGKSVFEAGSFELPAELAGPIKDGLVRVDTLRKTAQTSVTKERRPWITKRRLLVGGGLLATVVCLSVLGQFTGRNTPTQASTDQPRDVEADRPASRPSQPSPQDSPRSVKAAAEDAGWSAEQAATLTALLKAGKTKLYVLADKRNELFGVMTESRLSDLDWLKQFPTIQRVVLSQQSGNVEPDYEYIRSLPQLQSLEGARLSPADIRLLAESCPKLQSIQCAAMQETRGSKDYSLEEYATALKELKGLKHLCIRWSGDKSVIPTSLRECTLLEVVVFPFENSHRSGLLPVLSELRNLHTLFFENAERDYELDWGVLKACPSLKRLCMGAPGNRIEPDREFLACLTIPTLEYLQGFNGNSPPSDKAMIECRKSRPNLTLNPKAPRSGGLQDDWLQWWRRSVPSLDKDTMRVELRGSKLVSVPRGTPQSLSNGVNDTSDVTSANDDGANGGRKSVLMLRRVKTKMTKDTVRQVCGMNPTSQMPIGKGEMWLFEFDDGSTLHVTFDKFGEVLSAKDVTE